MRRRSAADLRRDRRARQLGRRRRCLPEVQGLEARQMLTVGIPPVVADAGFEAVDVGSGPNAYQRPVGSYWTYSTQAGVSANDTTLTSGNMDAPKGRQVAYLTGNATVSQSLAGWEAGAYVVTFRAARSAANAGVQSVQVKFDGVVVGTFTPSRTDYEAFSTNAFMASAGTHSITLAGVTAGGDVVFLDDVSVKAATPVVGDPGFESPVMASGTFGRPSSGSLWSFSQSGAGLSANGSLFTAQNSAAPQGRQVVYLQNTGSISQTLPGWTGGSYTISLKAAQRANIPGNAQTIQIKVDGVVQAEITPLGIDYGYGTYKRAISIPAGTHTITIAGKATTGDHTAFVDDVAISAAPEAPSIADDGFESAAVGTGSGAYAYRPLDAGWSFIRTAGVSANGTLFTSGNPNAPQGLKVGFVQATGSMSQTVAGWRAGAYALSFKAAQNGNLPGNAQTIKVLVDGEAVGLFTPTSTAYQSFTAHFAVPAGAHVVTFAGTAANDSTAFIDAVTIEAATPTVADSGFEQIVLGPNEFRGHPTGSPWYFFAGSGLSANNSGFTAYNPAAPQGPQVAYLSGRSRFEQSIPGWQAGSYAIEFKAAQRLSSTSVPNNQAIQVKVDGEVVGTFAPTGGGYQTFRTNAFRVIDGRHTLAFVGLDGTNLHTAFIDDVKIIPVAARPDSPGDGGAIVLNATIRDFLSSHPDFQTPIHPDDAVVTRGLVAPALGPDGLPVFIGANGAGTITSASTFGQWFRTIPGVNGEASHSLKLVETSAGSRVFEFSDDAFFPIDGRLLGDEGGTLLDRAFRRVSCPYYDGSRPSVPLATLRSVNAYRISLRTVNTA